MDGILWNTYQKVCSLKCDYKDIFFIQQKLFLKPLQGAVSKNVPVQRLIYETKAQP